MKNIKKKIQYCTRCLYSSSHPLGITFNDEGLCSGCEIHLEKNVINFKDKWEVLKKIIRDYKSKTSKNNYDCIIPVSGSGDSYYIMYLVKKLDLKPLMVSYNSYFNTKIGIKNLANLRIKFDTDIIFQNVNIKSVKKITKYTLMEYGNIYWPILAGQTAFPVQVAEKYKIPLIIWGAHQGLEQVGMFSHNDEVEMTRRYREDHDLFGLESKNLLRLDNLIKDEDVWQFKYPSMKNINNIGIRGIYLGNYVKWDPTYQHVKMIKKYKYTPKEQYRSFDSYNHIDCFNYLNIHDFLKLCKLGYSKVTDHACREIRHKRLNRNLAIKLVKKYEQLKPLHLDLFCEWLNIDQKSLNYVIDRHKNPNYWKQKINLTWSFSGHNNNIKNSKIEFKSSSINKYFKSKNSYKDKLDNKYITFGKGFS